MGGRWNGGLAVWKSTSGGSSWSKWKIYDESGYIRGLAIDPSDASTIFAIGEWWDASYNYTPILLKTTNGGTDWNEDATVSWAANTRRAYSIIFDPFNPQCILVGTDKGVLRSTDVGTTWSSTNLTRQTKHLIADPALENSMFAATRWDGVYESTNGGQTWSTMNDGLLDEYVNYIDIDPVNRYLYVATTKAGVFRYTLGASPVEETDSELPNRFVLHPNYPNPFNATTEIQYELSRPGHVRFIVYDIRGRAIQVLVDRYMIPGVNRITWDGRNESGDDVVSGVYLVRLVTEQGTVTQKMVLQR